MKKKASSKKIQKGSAPYSTNMKIKSAVSEPITFYQSVTRQLQPKEFTFQKFKKIYDTAPFTFKEWAGFMHLSERTLMRYSKENKSFEGIYTERIMMLERLFHKGEEIFSDVNAFYSWLRKPKKVLGRVLDINAMTSAEGILAVEEELGRMEHRVYI